MHVISGKGHIADHTAETIRTLFGYVDDQMSMTVIVVSTADRQAPHPLQIV